MKFKKIKDLYFFHPKSKIKAGEGLEEGKYPFYTSSSELTMWLNKHELNTLALVFGTGGSASLHYAEGPFSVSTDCLVLSSKQQEVNIKFTFYYLNSKFYLVEKGFKGAGLKHISKEYIENIEIEYPDLETQNKIIAILDKAKAILEKREKTIQKYDELIRSVFWKMFGDVFNHGYDGFVPLSTLVNRIDSGWSPVCEEKSRDISSQTAILKQGSVSRRHFIPDENKLLPAGLPIKKGVYAKHKDLLFSRKNTPELVGATAYLFEDYENLLLPDTIFNIRYDTSMVSGVYLYYLFNNVEFRKKIQQLSVGQAESMSNISQKRLLKFKIPLPDLREQSKFENIVETSYNSFLSNLKKSNLRIENLLKSLSQQVFSERVTIDVDIELGALLNPIDLEKKDEENRIDTLKKDVTFVQRLLDRINEQDYKDKDEYDKAQYVLFRIMKEESTLIKQIFKDGKIQLTLQNETT